MRDSFNEYSKWIYKHRRKVCNRLQKMRRKEVNTNSFAPTTGSPRFDLNAKDYTFIKFVLLHALVGAVVFILTAVVAHFDWGVWTPYVVPIAAVISATLTQWLNSK
jgi:hypothetical protein